MICTLYKRYHKRIYVPRDLLIKQIIAKHWNQHRANLCQNGPTRIFWSVLILFFVIGAHEKESLGSPLQAGVVSILAEKLSPNPILRRQFCGFAFKTYGSSPYPQRPRETIYIWPVERLKRIPGPIFLLVFICLSAICIIGGWVLVNMDGTGSELLPELTCLDPFAVAALRGGSTAVIKTAVLSLWNKNMIKLKSKGQWSMHDDVEAETEGSQEILLHPIEDEVLDFLQAFHRPSELLKNLRPQLKPHLRPIYDELEELHLVRTIRQRTKAWLVTTAVAFVILLLGGTKLYLGSIYKKPVGFLVLLLPGILVALFLVVKPWKRLTKLGYLYLKTLQKEFGWLQNIIAIERNPEGIDPVFCVAVFGVGALAGIPIYGAFTDNFQPTTGGWAGFGGGCGGGGCGGGCGGGGCGGCGG